MTRRFRLLLVALSSIVPSVLVAAPAAQARYLEFVEVKRDNTGGVDGLNGVEGITVSPDGKHVYVAGQDENALAVFRRDAVTGQLTFVEVKKDGSGGVDGLAGAQHVSLSPDGDFLYVSGSNEAAIAVFSRDQTTGKVTFVQVLKNGANGVSGLKSVEATALSPDGLFLYAAGEDDNDVVVFSRDPISGKLTFLEKYVDGTDGMDGLALCRSVVVSPDGATLYAVGKGDNAVAVFTRDQATGLLTFAQELSDGVAGVSGINLPRVAAISPDGANLYVTGGNSDSVATFAVDPATGLLTFVESLYDNTNGINGLNDAHHVVVTPDGTHVLVTAVVDDALAVFERDPYTGRLTFVEVHIDNQNGVDGMNGVKPVAVSPDGTTVYAGADTEDAVAVFHRACGDGVLDADEECDDGNALDGDCCSSSCKFEAVASSCPDDGDQCTVDMCDGFGTCSHVTSSGSCDDGQFCTVDDTCHSGVCQGTPRDCSGAASGQCQSGTCDEANARCVASARPNGSACDDGNACTQSDSCQAGTCTGTARPNGSTCDDGNACTQADTCQSGTCTGANPVVCAAQDQCHEAGTCNPSTGVCSTPNKANGTSCDDGNACTQADACQAGVCTGAARPNGTACSDGNACTRSDTCQGGQCNAGTPVVCSAQDGCHTAGTCDPASGTCSNPVRPDGATCDDGNACTQSDACVSGACVGANPVVCSASDQCHDAGSCDPSSGTCSNPAKTDGTSCDDGNVCTRSDTCHAGTCGGSAVADGTSCDDGDACSLGDRCQGGTCGGTPMVCSARDACHAAGTCNPATGVCSNPTQPDGTSCDDGNTCTDADSCNAGICTGSARADGASCNDGDACTQTDTCRAGFCVGANPVVCTARDACHLAASACDPALGRCQDPVAPDGTACDDGDANTTNDTCTAGLCTGQGSSCRAPDACHEAGVYDASLGKCVYANKPDGTDCDDGSACTTGDTCQAGLCSGGVMPDRDGDGVCDLVDVCPDVPNADQLDTDRNGIGDACECTQPAPGRCIAGGGSKKTDCMLEFNPTGGRTYNKKHTKLKKLLHCQDGDPACDLDGQKNGMCTFGVVPCLTNSDPRFPKCSVTGPLAFEVMKPRQPNGMSPDHMNMWALEEELRALGLQIRRHDAIFTPGKIVGDSNLCGTVIPLQVPAPTASQKRIRRTFRFRTTAGTGKRDRDKFILECK